MTRAPAGGPSGSTPGQTFPFGYHTTGGNIPNNGNQPLPLNTQPSGTLRTWADYLKEHLGDAVAAAAAWARDHAGQALDLGLGTAGMINAAQLGQKSSDYATGAYDQSQQNWQSREPLRLAGVEGMLHPVTSSDVSHLGEGARAANPFASHAALPIQHALTPQAPPKKAAALPLPLPGGPTPGVYQGFPEGLALSDAARNAPRV